MTNYAAWDAFDVDRAILEVDSVLAVAEFTSTSDATLTKRATENLQITVDITRKAADALRSKVNSIKFFLLRIEFDSSCAPVLHHLSIIPMTHSELYYIVQSQYCVRLFH